jgi:hypothetical protein
MEQWSRRELLEFLGITGLAAYGLSPLHALAAKSVPFKALAPSGADSFTVAEGFKFNIIASWGDPLNKAGDQFGFNNDYTAFIPLGKDDGLLWVNHENTNPLFVSGTNGARTKKQMEQEMKTVGGSIIRIKKSNDRWTLVENDPYNKRLDANTPIPLIADRPIEGSKTAIGTLANCAGGETPWGTVLTCEENYSDFWGEASYDQGKRSVSYDSYYGLGWEKFFQRPPEHYGWVVEVDVKTGKAKKLTAMGRFAHEGATVVTGKDGRPVAYMGDDARGEHIYKFVGAQKGSLEKGILYAADTVRGVWMPLHVDMDPRLKKAFKDQTELLIRTREAAKIVGATPQNRPEGIAAWNGVERLVVSLTNNSNVGNWYGSLLRIIEHNNDPLSTKFQAKTFAAGGPKSEFACPDNIVFDQRGNLWMTTDISGSSIGKEPYVSFGNNSLFYIPFEGPKFGRAYRVANAPVGSELTGPSFSPDGSTLFLSVQHPGEGSKDLKKPTSKWPHGGMPNPSVIALSGPALKKLVDLN